MNKPDAISLDYDSTLVDPFPLLGRWIKKHYGHYPDLKKAIEYYHFDNHYGPGFARYWAENAEQVYRQSRPFPGAIAFVHNLRVHFRVVLVTRSLSEEMAKAKELHAKQIFGFKPADIKHVFDLSKHGVTKEMLHVDDSMEHVLEHVKHNAMPAVLFNFRRQHGWARPVEHPLAMFATTFGAAYHKIMSQYAKL